MLVRRLLITLCVVSATLFGVACAPAAQSPDSAAVSAPATETETDTAIVTETETTTETVTTATGTEVTGTETTTETETTVTETVTNEVQSSEEGSVVDETPMSEEELANAPAGQSDPSAAGEGSQTEPQGSSEPPLPGELLVYADSAYGFSVGYPADYVFRTEPAEKLAPLDPKPVASFAIINPTLASSDSADLEPADLEIRVHPAEGAASLEDWLAARGFLAEGNLPVQPFQATHVTGLEVCASTMIAPGCSYFVLGDSWVYQMVPASLEGEAIMNSFALVR